MAFLDFGVTMDTYRIFNSINVILDLENMEAAIDQVVDCS